jgi:hypothetical protein
MKKTTILFTAIMVVLAISCKNIGFEKTKSGMEYKIIPGGKGKENLKKGDFVKLQDHLQRLPRRILLRVHSGL